MKSAAAARPLWQAAAVAAGLSSSAAMAAEWTVEPTAELFTLAQQNPRLIAGNDDDATAFGTRAAVRMQRRTEQLLLSIQPSAGLARYQNVEDLDRNDQQLASGFTWQGEHIHWRGTANGVRDTTLTSELGTTGLTQGNFRHENFSASLGPEWQLSERLSWGSTAAWQVERYPGLSGTVLTGSHYRTGSTYLGYNFSDRTAVSIAASAGRLTSGGGRPGSDNASVSLQVRHALSSLWTVDVSAGPSWIRPDDGKTQSGSIYDAGISRTLERGSLSFGVSRRQSPSGRGVLTEVEEASLGAVFKFTEQLTGTANAAMSHRTDALSAFGLDLQEVRYSHADLGVTWRPLATWQLSVLVGGSTQRADAFLRNEDTAHGYYTRVSLGWLGKPRVN